MTTQQSLYFIWGGVFTDMRFLELQEGAEECYGPLHSADDAKLVWSEKTRKNVDIAQHRLFIISVPRPRGKPVAAPITVRG